MPSDLPAPSPVPPPGRGGATPPPLDLSRRRRTSPLAALFEVVRPDRVRAALPLLVIAISSGRVVTVLGLGLVVGALVGAVAWWRRTWCYAEGVLHLDEGVFVRNQRRIPVERIQHVESMRLVRHQLFGLSELRIETAGGSGAELRLDAIPRQEAEQLRDEVLRARRAGLGAEADDGGVDGAPDEGDGTAVVDAGRTLVRVPARRLLLAGITGPEVVVVLTALGFGLEALGDLGVDPESLESIDIGTVAAVFLGLVAVPVWFLAAGLVSVVRRWNLTARLDGDELRVSYGLLRHQEFVVRCSRIQHVTITERALLRPFGLGDLRLRSAASGTTVKGLVYIPLLRDLEIDELLATVVPAVVPRPALAAAPPAARRRAWVRAAVTGGLAAGALAVLAAASRAWLLLPLAAVVLVVALVGGELSWRGLGWASARGSHHSRRGALRLVTDILPPGRVQSTSVLSSWFQRRRGLASARLDLPGAAVPVIDRDADEARTIGALVLAR